MADRGFEIELDRMFAAHPDFPDSDLFAGQVQIKMNRGLTFRGFFIGGLGVIGGLIGGAQILGSGLGPRLGALTAQSNHFMNTKFADLAAAHVLPGGFAVNGEIVWMSAGLAVVAIGLALTRAIREI
jgi:hypothetical protein